MRPMLETSIFAQRRGERPPEIKTICLKGIGEPNDHLFPHTRGCGEAGAVAGAAVPASGP